MFSCCLDVLDVCMCLLVSIHVMGLILQLVECVMFYHGQSSAPTSICPHLLLLHPFHSVTSTPLVKLVLVLDMVILVLLGYWVWLKFTIECIMQNVIY